MWVTLIGIVIRRGGDGSGDGSRSDNRFSVWREGRRRGRMARTIAIARSVDGQGSIGTLVIAVMRAVAKADRVGGMFGLLHIGAVNLITRGLG